MAAAETGAKSTLYISGDDGTTWKKVGGIVKIGFNFDVSMIETTDNDSEQAKEIIPGNSEAAISCDGNYEEGDDGQDLVFTKAFVREKVKIIYRPKGNGATLRQLKFDAYFDKLPVESPQNSKIDFNWSAMVTGKVLVEAQTSPPVPN